MDLELAVRNAPDGLEIKKFSAVLNSPSQCYKFYWLEGILQLMKETGQREFRFEEIIDRMIANAWYTVTMYHLHLGPGRIDNAHSDKVEDAVLILKECVPELPVTASRERVIAAIHQHENELYYAKNELTKNVPYRLLSPFLNVETNDWYKRDRIISIINDHNQTSVLPYNIIKERRALDSRIVVNEEWARWILLEYPILIDWINYNKVIFLQGRNPEVPGIIYKLEPPSVRKLDEIKNLWKAILDRNPVTDIYTGKLLNEERYDIDHFIPWSYVAMDEIWDLIPADRSCNTSKNNRLPEWNTYSDGFLNTQFMVYQEIFSNDQIYDLFEKCRRHNLNSRWAVDQLYVSGHSDYMFKSILEKNLKRVYDAAAIQGFTTWKAEAG